jgi:hypothetical protein
MIENVKILENYKKNELDDAIEKCKKNKQMLLEYNNTGMNPYYQNLLIYPWMEKLLDTNYETLEQRIEHEIMKDVKDVLVDYDKFIKALSFKPQFLSPVDLKKEKEEVVL